MSSYSTTTLTTRASESAPEEQAKEPRRLRGLVRVSLSARLAGYIDGFFVVVVLASAILGLGTFGAIYFVPIAWSFVRLTFIVVVFYGLEHKDPFYLTPYLFWKSFELIVHFFIMGILFRMVIVNYVTGSNDYQVIFWLFLAFTIFYLPIQMCCLYFVHDCRLFFKKRLNRKKFFPDSDSESSRRQCI